MAMILEVKNSIAYDQPERRATEVVDTQPPVLEIVEDLVRDIMPKTATSGFYQHKEENK